MIKKLSLTLNSNDYRVVASREAEQRLYAYYGLEIKDYYIKLKNADVKIRVTEVGKGDPVVLVPGNTGDVFPFIPLIAELREKRIIAINRPGGGLSDGMNHRNVDFHKLAIETIETVMDFFKIDIAPLMGHSIGGHWCQWFAMDRPKRISALILIGVPGNIMSTCPPLVLRLLSIPVLNSLLYELVASKNKEKSLGSLKLMGHCEQTLRKLPKAMSDCYYYFQKLPNYKISSLSMMEKINRPWGSNPSIQINEEQLRSIKHPVMYLWGTNDPFGSIEIGRRIARYVNNSEFHAVQNAGHLPWLDKTQECGRLVVDFLNKNEIVAGK